VTSDATRAAIASGWTRWARFALCAAIVNASALALIWVWRESAATSMIVDAPRASVEPDGIRTSLAPNVHVEEEDAPQSPAADLAVRAITSELGDLGSTHPWAGKYLDCSEIGGGRELLIAPHNGFAWAYPREMGSILTIFGAVREVGGLLELVRSPDSTDGIDDAPPPPTFLVPVEWSGQHHLVEPKYWQRWITFAKREWPAEYEPHNYEHGSFWLRKGEELGAHSGASQPPAAYRKAWAERRQAHVTTVGAAQPRANPSAYSTTLALDAGSAEGIVEGMRLFVDELPDLDRPLLVLTVSEHACTAVLEQIAADERMAHVGWTCSTMPRLE
jgi:hypothetical protein